MQVGPHDRAIDAPGRSKQMVVVVPVDSDIDEAEDVAHENRPELYQRRPVVAVRDLQLEHHDRDDDGEHAVAERLQPSLGHMRVSHCKSAGLRP